MAGYYVNFMEELHKVIKSLISPGETVGCGDSVTLEQTDILDIMRCNDYRFLDKHRPELTPTRL